jgi:hypothetical protein
LVPYNHGNGTELQGGRVRFLVGEKTGVPGKNHGSIGENETRHFFKNNTASKQLGLQLSSNKCFHQTPQVLLLKFSSVVN